LLPQLEARGIKWFALMGHLMLSWAELGLGNLVEARDHALKSLQAAVELRTFDWASFSIMAMANILASDGQPERAAALLSFVSEYPRGQHFMRENAKGFLAELQQKLPPDLFATAVERGKTLQFDDVVAELLAES